MAYNVLELKDGKIQFTIRIAEVRGGYMYGYDMRSERWANGANQYADPLASEPFKTLEKAVDSCKRTMLYCLVKNCNATTEEIDVFTRFCSLPLKDTNDLTLSIILLCLPHNTKNNAVNL